MRLHNSSLKTKLLLLSFVGIVGSILMALVGYVALVEANKTESFLAEDAVPSLVLISGINDLANNVRESELGSSIAGNVQEVKDDEARMTGYTSVISEKMSQYERAIDNDEERRLFTSLQSKLTAYRAAVSETFTSAKSGDYSGLDEMRRRARVDSGKAFRELGDALDSLVSFNEKAVEQAHTSAVSAGHRAVATLAGLAFIVAILLLVFGTWMRQILMRQFGGEPSRALEVARAVAKGDLSLPIDLTVGDNSSVMASLKEMQNSLSETVLQVRRSAEGVATASTEISQGNNDLSARTEQQASSLEETSASMEQLGSTVKQNADSAREASRLAAEASAVAAESGLAVGEVVTTMKGINESSKRIVDIIAVIDGIAFQTNILALNAAVEAARAGEQGRGFAVVASEVRGLAHRSAAAAKEIKELIVTSVERVEHGSVQVDRAGTTMQGLVASINQLTALIAEISHASGEQSAGVNQVGEAVTQMDHATQQNAALVEESAAAAQSLKAQADQLVSAVAVFKTA